MTPAELQATIDLAHSQLDAFTAENLAADRAMMTGSVAGLIAVQAKSAREAIGIEEDGDSDSPAAV